MTLESLSNIKNPPVVYAKQATCSNRRSGDWSLPFA